MVEVDELVPPGPLAAWMDDHIATDRGRPVAVEQIGEGKSNLTFRVRRGDHRWVLRRPPMGDIPESAHDVLREHKVLTGLARTDVRVPVAHAACTDEAVIGVPFYLMDEVDGHVIRGDHLPPTYTPEHRGAVGLEAIDALAELHTADIGTAGLRDLGRPDGYTARQVARWTKQWSVMATRDLPDIEAVREWLEAHVPETSQTAIVHGDYKLDNVVFSQDAPPRLLAILDWEMATLGDPLADLGYLMMFWPEAGEENIGGLPQPTQLPGFLPRAALIERYEQRTGFAMTDLTFYRTLALWKLAILSEGLYKRHLAGKTTTDWFAVLEHAVPRMAAAARSWSGA